MDDRTAATVADALAVARPGEGPATALPAACRELLDGTGGPALVAAAALAGGVSGLASTWPALRARAVRRAAGAWYTPADLVDHLVALALPDDDGPLGAVVDPACGAGAFLVAAARRLAEQHRTTPAEVVGAGLVRGIERDPVAAALALLALEETTGEPPPPDVVAVGDALLDPWPAAIGPVAAVVGNPPFLGRLRRATDPGLVARAALTERFGSAAAGYTDVAGLFLLLALDVVGAGGRIALVQPASFLGARDADAVRSAVARAASLEAVWEADRDDLFAGAAVTPWAPVLRVGASSTPRAPRWRGVPVRPDGHTATTLPADGAPWGGVLAGTAPRTPVPSTAATPLGERWEVTADFRDRYYALVPHVVDDGDVPVVTSGLVDPCHLRWGERPARLGGRRWQRPSVRRAEVDADPATAAWVARRLVAKVLVANQTRGLEAVADPEGRLLPSVPVLGIAADPDEVWLALAAVLAPPSVARAAATQRGTALSAAAIRVSVPLLRALPLPVDVGAWADAAAAACAAQHATDAGSRADALAKLAVAGCAAHRLTPAETDEHLTWWRTTLPRR